MRTRLDNKKNLWLCLGPVVKRKRTDFYSRDRFVSAGEAYADSTRIGATVAGLVRTIQRDMAEALVERLAALGVTFRVDAGVLFVRDCGLTEEDKKLIGQLKPFIIKQLEG